MKLRRQDNAWEIKKRKLDIRSSQRSIGGKQKSRGKAYGSKQNVLPEYILSKMNRQQKAKWESLSIRQKERILNLGGIPETEETPYEKRAAPKLFDAERGKSREIRSVRRKSGSRKGDTGSKGDGSITRSMENPINEIWACQGERVLIGPLDMETKKSAAHPSDVVHEAEEKQDRTTNTERRRERFFRENRRQKEQGNRIAGGETFLSVHPEEGWETDKKTDPSVKKQSPLHRKSGGTKNILRYLDREIEKDKRREEQIRREQRELTVELFQERMQERVVRITSLPVRFRFHTARGEVKKKIMILVTGMLRYIALMGVPLLVLILILQMILAMAGSFSGEEEGGYPAQGYEIVEYAISFVGKTRYVWGAGRGSATDWQDYADCSSFVHGVFNHFGYEIGSTTFAMENSGEKVSGGLAEAVPGDIILFYSGGIAPGNSSHVGIYMGEGQMVDCEGGQSNATPATAGRGVTVTRVEWDGRPYVVRRIIKEGGNFSDGSATAGHRKDPTSYSRSQLELIWAIVAQEDNGSYKGALAVISCAMNRTDSSNWKYCGSTALAQLTAPGQFCYSIDSYWQARLNGNVPDYVKQAVNDCLKKGIRNHRYTSFRSTKGSQTGANAVQIGGNWFFGN